VAKYTPVENGAVKFHHGKSRGFPPVKLKQGMNTETEQKNEPFIKIANPITQGDKTTGRGRYEKGRMNKSRS